jgi:hypothetical protein
LPNNPVWREYSFVRYYSVVNEVDKAVKWMREMVARGYGVVTSITYTPPIHSLYESGRVRDTRRFMIEMVESRHLPREHTYKFVKDAIEEAGGEALPADLCHSIDDDITERFQHVMRMKPIMRLVTVLSRTEIELVQT